MNAASKQKDTQSAPKASIAQNKRARFDSFIEEKLEAGLALQGWEVKSLRAGKAQITEGYVLIKDGEAFLNFAGQGSSRFGRLAALVDPLGHLLSTEREQHAEDDHADLARERPPSIERPGNAQLHARSPLVRDRQD